jgi:type I restriction enzyme M protein
MADGVEAKARQNTPVFTYLCSEIGETRDTYRFEIEQNDLESASTLYTIFKAAGERLEHINDARCKIVSIDDFYDGTHWSIERWWSREERVSLGIEEEAASVSLEGFVEMVDDAAVSLTQFEEPIRELLKKKEIAGSLTVNLSDIFDLSLTTNGSWFTKAFVNTHSGDIPVYGASKNPGEVGYGFIQDDVQGVKYFSDCLTWNIDGSFGIFLRKGRFSLSEKVIPLVLKQEYIGKLSLEFLRVVISSEVLKTPFSFTNKGGKKRFGSISIEIPTGSDGEFDFEAQNEIASQHSFIEQVKGEIAEKSKYIAKIAIEPESTDYPMIYKSIPDLFDIERGSGRYTKTVTIQGGCLRGRR